MGGKKAPGRFTIQFNMDDPQQRTVAELLEPQGRRKAQFLTSAVLRYVQEPQGGTSAGVNEAALEQMMLSILRTHPQSAAAGREAVPAPAAKAAPPSGAWADGGGDALQAITNTLAAFQKK